MAQEDLRPDMVQLTKIHGMVYQGDLAPVGRMMSAVSASSSGRPLGFLRWVDRCWPRTLQANRSETENFAIT